MNNAKAFRVLIRGFIILALFVITQVLVFLFHPSTSTLSFYHIYIKTNSILLLVLGILGLFIYIARDLNLPLPRGLRIPDRIPVAKRTMVNDQGLIVSAIIPIASALLLLFLANHVQ